MLEAADKIRSLPPYILAEVFAARDRKLEQGVDVIDLGVGNPDLRPPEKVIRALHDSLDDVTRENHRYPSFAGLPEFKAAIARWYSKRFNVSLEPGSEVLPLIGSKEGLAKFMMAHLNAGDTILIASPCYPAYLGAATVAQASIYEVPLLEENDFLPRLEDIPAEVVKRAKLILVNYPNNPTGAVATDDFYERLRKFALENDIFVMSDIAYCDLSLDSKFRARSFLEFDRNKETSIEFHSFSKSFSMQGWRLGFACGNKTAVGNLLKIKTNMDFGVFMAVQRAGMAALEDSEALTAAVSDVYRKRRDVLLGGLRKNGWDVRPPSATMYVWLKIPRSYASSAEFTGDLLEKTGVVVAPGIGFGKYGEGYVRISLTVSEERLVETVKRIREAGFTY
ncbi:MAG: aminotransferase class I/II-fold pyridoxal phosphate-dependent enzyme [Candidatus Eiseniibacteriota bacterium]|nr:MAG: aminotransferase class I/II-fold pyridoxal phosphate-dependent enzyme [Candidatus Eisenbacteria bacterium]